MPLRLSLGTLVFGLLLGLSIFVGGVLWNRCGGQRKGVDFRPPEVETSPGSQGFGAGGGGRGGAGGAGGARPGGGAPPGGARPGGGRPFRAMPAEARP